jgi:hypothetical protein
VKKVRLNRKFERVLGHSGSINFRLLGKGLGLLATCVVVLALGGCGGIEFQGKLFDYAGLSGNGIKEDVRMTDQAPLLIPPDTHRLPPPGPAAVTPVDWPVDTDLERKKVATAKEAADRKKAAETEREPRDPYAGKPKLLDNLLAKYKKKPEVDTVNVPEPDPSDTTPQDRARERAAATPQKPVDQTLNAPTPTEDPFHPAAPDSYKSMTSPSGNNANY